MFKTSSALSEAARQTITASLQLRLLDGIDLYSQVKVAHWNVRGPNFMMLHEMFDKLASHINDSNDEIAERAVALGARAPGTIRQAAKASTLVEIPGDLYRGPDLVRAVVDRVTAHLGGLRDARRVADEQKDLDTSDLLTGIVEETEKYAWFLHATLDD